ncbi:G-protein-signaling modulator 1 [Microcaecilia unicolor]|uniref:G-protein-signaling modulator 1-like n=1 Tax=Microcaecilia unicolor TaxID=1415580 RepID=A0A6P7XRR8_9AMPH|nr:G-protein-signaling modulator 1-like [Microcaecilia unicolor]XP_030053140.1 G-protein-signaling modulator 1-like [Microcaecilia unicolor]XP_030053141.1 G-protein-signaling modulator 1-like [Microcaecilia unicolor]
MLSLDKADTEVLSLRKDIPKEEGNKAGDVKETRPDPKDGEDSTENLPQDAPASEDEDDGGDFRDLAWNSPEQEALTFLLLDGDKTVIQKPLTPDFSDTETFFDLLCHFQSRRMNDQRCSFRRKPRGDTRPWNSAPSSPVRERRAVFASTMSLQTEEFFDLVAWSQARRLDDQRANPLEAELLVAKPRNGRGSFNLIEREGRKSWRKVRQRAVTEPCRVPDEELYNTILTHQSERIEEQRSDPPLPVAASDLFDLLLRLQGERMDEQRVELPPALLQHEVNLC